MKGFWIRIIFGLGGILNVVVSIVALHNNNLEGGIVFLLGAVVCGLICWDWWSE